MTPPAAAAAELPTLLHLLSARFLPSAETEREIKIGRGSTASGRLGGAVIVQPTGNRKKSAQPFKH